MDCYAWIVLVILSGFAHASIGDYIPIYNCHVLHRRDKST